ncbi:hypothetical protein GMAR_ORF238 [Golden Marseillevirus]|uniref:hypothetical protein n=1 Tax=Golden Marseillevirus TaxID=1720526 RepID=UPI000877AEE2|nr:hypothetical protein GMAR_ORF238 [Golden Marseillevirus]ALX27612.1 hypothetical protein GMAR_ORF238 [Golden Marseillevirus]
MQVVDAMDHYTYGLCSLGKRKSEAVDNQRKKLLTEQMALDAKVTNTFGYDDTLQLRQVLRQRLAHIEEMKRMLREQLEQKEAQKEAVQDERVLHEFLVACEMAGMRPDSGAVERFTQARRKFVVAKRQQ